MSSARDNTSMRGRQTNFAFIFKMGCPCAYELLPAKPAAPSKTVKKIEPDAPEQGDLF